MSEVWTGHTNPGSFFCTKTWHKWIIQLNHESMFSLPFLVNWPGKSAVTAFHFSEATNCLWDWADLLAVRYIFCLYFSINMDKWMDCRWILTAVSFLSPKKTNRKLPGNGHWRGVWIIASFFFFVWNKSIMWLFDMVGKNCPKLRRSCRSKIMVTVWSKMRALVSALAFSITCARSDRSSEHMRARVERSECSIPLSSPTLPLKILLRSVILRSACRISFDSWFLSL